MQRKMFCRIDKNRFMRKDITKKKILLITPMLQPYRITFYDKLSKMLEDRAELMVFHGTKSKEDGRPSFKGETPFPERGFPARTINVLRLNMVVNDGMFRTMKSYDPDLVIMQGIGGDISLRRISKWVRQHHKKLVFWTCGWEPGRAKRYAARPEKQAGLCIF